jgi:hypothetical protein
VRIGWKDRHRLWKVHRCKVQCSVQGRCGLGLLVALCFHSIPPLLLPRRSASYSTTCWAGCGLRAAGLALSWLRLLVHGLEEGWKLGIFNLQPLPPHIHHPTSSPSHRLQLEAIYSPLPSITTRQSPAYISALRWLIFTLQARFSLLKLLQEHRTERYLSISHLLHLGHLQLRR